MITCPECNGTTDTGGECNDCDFDWKYDARTEKQKFIDEWTRLIKTEASKEELADFARFNAYGESVEYSPYGIDAT